MAGDVNYFTSDTHFGHKNVIGFCQRPFADVAEMDADEYNAIMRAGGPAALALRDKNVKLRH